METVILALIGQYTRYLPAMSEKYAPEEFPPVDELLHKFRMAAQEYYRLNPDEMYKIAVRRDQEAIIGIVTTIMRRLGLYGISIEPVERQIACRIMLTNAFRDVKEPEDVPQALRTIAGEIRPFLRSIINVLIQRGKRPDSE